MQRVSQTLVILCVGVFFVQSTRPDIVSGFEFWPGWFATRPWTVVTYMFLHGGLMHLVFNMVGLYMFGGAVETRLGSRRFTILYFLSGISGAFLNMLFSGAALIGASAGVFGVMLAFARYWPDTPLAIYGLIPVKARTLIILLTISSIWFGLSGHGGNVAHLAHLGGFVGAWFYLKWVERTMGSFKKLAESARPEQEKKLGSWRAIDLNSVHAVNRDEVARLIDKIEKQGSTALTPQERLFLSNFVPTDTIPPVS